MGTKLSPSKGGRRGRGEERPEEKGTHLGTKLPLSQGARCRRGGVREGLGEGSFLGSKQGHELAHRVFVCLFANIFLLPNFFPLPDMLEIQSSFQKCIQFICLGADVSLSGITLLDVFVSLEVLSNLQIHLTT